MRKAYSRPWRRGSDYAAPPRNELDRTQRHVWRRRVVAEARGGNLPGKAVLTAEAMLACMGEDGRLYPSQAAISEKAGIGLRTVSRHLKRMIELGLIRIHRRLVRRPWPEGGRGATRVEQTTNAYELLFPSGSVVTKARAIRVLNTGRQNGPQETNSRFIPASFAERANAQRALELVRARREITLAASWKGGVPRCSIPQGQVPRIGCFTALRILDRPYAPGPLDLNGTKETPPAANTPLLVRTKGFGHENLISNPWEVTAASR